MPLPTRSDFINWIAEHPDADNALRRRLYDDETTIEVLGRFEFERLFDAATTREQQIAWAQHMSKSSHLAMGVLDLAKIVGRPRTPWQRLRRWLKMRGLRHAFRKFVRTTPPQDYVSATEAKILEENARRRMDMRRNPREGIMAEGHIRTDASRSRTPRGGDTPPPPWPVRGRRVLVLVRTRGWPTRLLAVRWERQERDERTGAWLPSRVERLALWNPGAEPTVLVHGLPWEAYVGGIGVEAGDDPKRYKRNRGN